ncbi:MAG TPA: rhomboid family intramembrane serine protease [Chthonomonadaceae bacterium]|nr:rhomboid family intramembrane serine protease [Chthonomonadaceae bacterium]
MLPYASDHRPSKPPVVTWALLATVSLLSAGTMLADRIAGPGRSAEIVTLLGITPQRFQPLTLLTYSFIHVGPAHLLINLFYLYVFGAGVEDAVGRLRYLLLYVASGVVGGVLQWLVTVTLLPPTAAALPVVGASAACAGLMGLFAVRYYRARLALVGLPFRPHVVSVVALFLVMEIGLGLFALVVGSATDGVAHWAHVGGFVFGLTCAHLLRLSESGSRAYLAADANEAMDSSVPGAAIKKWELLLSREPDNPGVQEELARAWIALGDGDQAVEHYLGAITQHLVRADRGAAARIFAELHTVGLPANEYDRTAKISTRRSLSSILLEMPAEQLFAIGNALEVNDQNDLATEAFRVVAMRAPNSAEGETAVLKCATISLRKLGRAREARVLADLFIDRYTNSPFRLLAEEVRRDAERAETHSGG